MNEEEIKKIVDWMIETGTQNTETGDWFFYIEDISNIFDIPEDIIIRNRYKLMKQINSRKEIIEETVYDIESFELFFSEEYCQLIQ